MNKKINNTYMSLNTSSGPSGGESPVNPVNKVYGTFLLAFYYFSAESIDLESLLKIAKSSGCPNDNVAQSILTKMVKEGYLIWSKTDGKVYFSRTELGKQNTPPPPPGPIPRTAPYN